MMYQFKKIIKRILKKGYYPHVEFKCRIRYFGTGYGGWAVPDGFVNKASVIYSFGVGQDVSFDLKLIENFGVVVHAFDPTPKSIAWVSQQEFPHDFRFHPIGLADFDGEASFVPPDNPDFVSYKMVSAIRNNKTETLPVRRLSTIMAELGHTQVDVLKMDIEGSEYAVLDDIMGTKIRPEIILVEFHHRWPEFGVEKTKQAINILKGMGYRIFYVSAQEEFGFLYSAMEKTTERDKVFFIGTFPPPVQGMSVVTQAIYERLESLGFSLVKVNTSPPTLRRGLFPLQRLPIMFKSWFRLMLYGRNQVLYIPLAGGWGQLYDCFTLLLARFLGMRCILHHHSSAYLTSKRFVTKCLVFIAGKYATHVVLCGKMESKLRDLYSAQKVAVLSNLALFPMEATPKGRNRLDSIGFLSNLTAEKGGWDIVELARVIKKHQLSLRVKVAGPCLESDLEQALRQADQEGILEWYGPLYGEDKQDFFESIDAFVFPTQYRNEAEPLVLWETLAAGVPVISYDRGCIPDQVERAGTIIPGECDFVVNALKVLEEWIEFPEKYRNRVRVAREQFNTVRSSAETQWKSLLEMIQHGG